MKFTHVDWSPSPKFPEKFYIAVGSNKDGTLWAGVSDKGIQEAVNDAIESADDSGDELQQSTLRVFEVKP